MDLSDDFADIITEHAVDLMRFQEGLRRRVRRRLKALEQDLIRQLERIDPTAPGAESYKRARIEKLIKQTKDTIRTSYRGTREELKSELRAMSKLEMDEVNVEINSILKTEVATGALPPNAIRDIVNNTLIQGSVLSDWLNRAGVRLSKALENEMTIGVLAGEPLGDLVRRIRGTQVPGAPRGTYEGGIMSTSTREAETLARTAAQHISNEVRFNMYKENSNIIKGVQALVTLDTRTSALCISRSGGAWNLETGKPLPQSTVRKPFPGAPPWHFNCRSTLLPITRTFEELGVRTKAKIPSSTQASMNGQVAGDLTYEQWLKKRPKAVQDEVLGKQKATLWRAGKIKSLRELVDQSGRPYTLEALEGRIARKR